MKIEELLTYKRILILGYGAEGQATERFLKKFHPDAEIGIADQKDDPQYLDRQKEYDLAIRTPLLRPKYLTIPYTTATNLFFANVANTIIGVTGTKGKSTTVSLLDHVLQSAGIKSKLYGNIGKPMLDVLTEGIDPSDIFVLELSSYQLEDIHYSPQIACFLNIYQELHNHDTYEEYLTAKTHITTYQKSSDHFFYNGTINDVAQLSQTTRATSHDFTNVSLNGLDISSLPFLTHEHNLKAVWSLAKHMNVTYDQYLAALSSYQPLEHRVARVGTFNEITFYDDSASVHPHSTIFALSAVANVHTIILGGQNRGYSFVELVNELALKNISHVILFPETGALIEEEIKRHNDYSPVLFHASTMQEAIEYAYQHTPAGKVCLLSPGAPSYLMYNNLHERGLDFVSTIKDYAQKESSSKEST